MKSEVNAKQSKFKKNIPLYVLLLPSIILLILFFILTVYNGFGDNQNGINSMRRKLQISVRRLLHA